LSGGAIPTELVGTWDAKTGVVANIVIDSDVSGYWTSSDVKAKWSVSGNILTVDINPDSIPYSEGYIGRATYAVTDSGTKLTLSNQSGTLGNALVLMSPMTKRK
jgi:hypothetical protein